MSAKRILIVEDEQHIQYTLKLFLQYKGYEIEVADNGRLALELFRRDRDLGASFDLVLTDIKMPEMDGPEMVEIMRAEGYDGPVIVMTGYGAEQHFKRLRQAKCSGMVEKPFTPSSMETLISQTLEC